MVVSVNEGESTYRELLLDLLNSTPIVAGEPTDDLVDPSSGRKWFVQRGFEVPATDVAGLRRLRDTLQSVVRGIEPSDALAPHLDGVIRIPRLESGVVQWEWGSATVPIVDARLVLEWAELNETMPGRLRPCGNDDCARFLLDRTRAGTARWCSMAGCGNRIKARRHAARASQSGASRRSD